MWSCVFRANYPGSSSNCFDSCCYVSLNWTVILEYLRIWEDDYKPEEKCAYKNGQSEMLSQVGAFTNKCKGQSWEWLSFGKLENIPYIKYLGLGKNAERGNLKKRGGGREKCINSTKQEDSPDAYAPLLSRTLLIIELKMVKWELTIQRYFRFSQLDEVLGADSIVLQVSVCCWKRKSFCSDCFLRNSAESIPGIQAI